jgi:MSHA biogenesis protein MshP
MTRSTMRWRQAGFSLVTAIFLLVVLAGLLGYMINLSVVQHNTVVMSFRGALAMQAARSALDSAFYRVLKEGFDCNADPTLGGPVGFSAVEAPALQSFTVNLSCYESNHVEGVDSVTVYELTAVASSGSYSNGGGANPDYVSRRIRATVSTLPP